MTMIAGLPMYDPPELRGVIDAWWAGLARAFRREGISDVPDRLDRSVPMRALWSDPRLFFTQTCGLPLIGEWREQFRYVATPRYAAPDCRGAEYCSLIVVPAAATAQSLADLRGKRCLINGRHSHSGFNALRAAVAPLARDGRFFGSVVETGHHFTSIAALGRNEGDVAAIDCVTYAVLSRCRPQAIAATRVIGRTAYAPGLPYVVRFDQPPEFVERCRAALMRAIEDPSLTDVRQQLLIDGIEILPLERYERIADFAAEAERYGYTELD